jgi:hypothetical protein
MSIDHPLGRLDPSALLDVLHRAAQKPRPNPARLKDSLLSPLERPTADEFYNSRDFLRLDPSVRALLRR